MKRFLDYTEIRTKITSVTVFGMTILWLIARGIKIQAPATATFFGSMLLFDLTTTAINNYIDTKTDGESLPYERNVARNIILVLLGASVASGLLLVAMTDCSVLLLGIPCFACGILYTYGPVAISRIPLGEIFSGFFYGVMIPLILAVINLPPSSIFAFEADGAMWSLHLNMYELLRILLFGIVPAFTTAGIMLANNISDLSKDIENGRFTLPYYIKGNALPLFVWLYRMCYLAVLLAVVLKILPWTALLMMWSYPSVERNTKLFLQKQSKAETFIISIKNYLLINLSLALGIFIGIIL